MLDNLKHKQEQVIENPKKEKIMKLCQEIMTENPACCLASDKVYSIAQQMQSEDIGALPVVENHDTNKLIGIITDRDLAVRVVGASRETTDTQIQEVMTSNPIVCHPTDNIDNILELMASNQIRRIPVVDKQWRVVGIISQADIAIRLDNKGKTALMIEQISQPDLVSSNG